MSGRTRPISEREIGEFYESPVVGVEGFEPPTPSL